MNANEREAEDATGAVLEAFFRDKPFGDGEVYRGTTYRRCKCSECGARERDNRTLLFDGGDRLCFSCAEEILWEVFEVIDLLGYTEKLTA